MFFIHQSYAYLPLTFTLKVNVKGKHYNFEREPPPLHVKISVTEISIRVSWFGGEVGVWHMWVNLCDCGKFW